MVNTFANEYGSYNFNLLTLNMYEIEFSLYTRPMLSISTWTGLLEGAREWVSLDWPSFCSILHVVRIRNNEINSISTCSKWEIP